MSKKQKCPALTFLYFCLELFVIGVKATKSSIFNKKLGVGVKRPISTKRMSFPNKKNNQIEQDLTF